MLRLQIPLNDKYTSASQDELKQKITYAKQYLGERLLILGHHYQRDEVMEFADARGDSLALSRIAAERHKADYVIFCGVHFMAEAADILTQNHQKVILPDLNAGCSMADMADEEEVQQAWEQLSEVIDIKNVIPITYINSSAALKAFVGKNNGAVCTSSNARAILTWALQQGEKVLFFPDQHLGRNTGFQLGYKQNDMALYNPRYDLGGLDEKQIKEATLLLWKGHCSVHQRFSPSHIDSFRQKYPQGIVVVHPECSHEVVELADKSGSTDFIIKTVNQTPAGSVLGIGTEIHLVNRLKNEHPDKTIVSLDPLVCPCSTMFRIDLPHLAWILDHLVNDEVVNQIVVDPQTAHFAKLALDKMLSIA